MPCFTEDQRRQLKNLGVTAAQRDALETVIPIGRAWLGRPPALPGVRSELQALSLAMRQAHQALSRLLIQTPTEQEAAARVVGAVYEMGGSGEAIKKTLDAAVLIHDAAESAIRELQQEPRRNRTASIKPVVIIAAALSSGFAKGQRTIHAHVPDPNHEPPVTARDPPDLSCHGVTDRHPPSSGEGGEDREASQPPAPRHDAVCNGVTDPEPTSPGGYTPQDDAWLTQYIRQRKAKRQAVQPGFFKPSASLTSKFRKIVGICYEAMGQGHADPERAIKAYIAEAKRTTAETGTPGC